MKKYSLLELIDILYRGSYQENLFSPHAQPPCFQPKLGPEANYLFAPAMPNSSSTASLYVQIPEDLMAKIEDDIPRSGQGTKKRYVTRMLQTVLSEDSQLVFDESKLGDLLKKQKVLEAMPLDDIQRLAKIHRRTDDQMILYLVDIGLRLIKSQAIV